MYMLEKLVKKNGVWITTVPTNDFVMKTGLSELQPYIDKALRGISREILWENCPHAMLLKRTLKEI